MLFDNLIQFVACLKPIVKGLLLKKVSTLFAVDPMDIVLLHYSDTRLCVSPVHLLNACVGGLDGGGEGVKD